VDARIRLVQVQLGARKHIVSLKTGTKAGYALLGRLTMPRPSLSNNARQDENGRSLQTKSIVLGRSLCPSDQAKWPAYAS
jgi:hypothetical protein